MDGNKIFSLPEPEQDNEPATKKYVDDLQNQYIDKRGNVKFDRNINVGNNRIFALKDPKKDYEATNKKYVDESITKRLQEEKDNFLPQDPATKEYVDEAIKGIAGGDILVSKEGVFIKDNGHYRATAPLDIDNQKMENLPDPVDEKDAVNKKYIDGIVENLTLKQGLVRENGGFNLVDSYINMNFNNIRNVGNPKNGADAVPFSFLDDMIKKSRRKNWTVNTSYCGPLKEGEYPFKFGGRNLEICEEVFLEDFQQIKGLSSGYVMPHSGRIKKIICEGLTYINFSQMFDELIKSLNKEQVNELENFYGKYDFKNNLIKGIRKYVDFSTYNNIKDEVSPPKGKTFFKIVKFTKNFFYDGRTIPGILLDYSVYDYDVIEEFEKVEVTSTYGLHENKTIMKFSNHDIIQLKEGETINIRISDYHKNLFSKDDILGDILKKDVIRLFGSKLNFNFTFLIELDPS